LTERGYRPVRYADDFCVFCTELAGAEAAWWDTEKILTGLKLRLEPRKTAIVHFDEGFDYLGVHFYRDTYSFLCENKRIKVQGPFDRWLFYEYTPDGYDG